MGCVKAETRELGWGREKWIGRGGSGHAVRRAMGDEMQPELAGGWRGVGYYCHGPEGTRGQLQVTKPSPIESS